MTKKFSSPIVFFDDENLCYQLFLIATKKLITNGDEIFRHQYRKSVIKFFFTKDIFFWKSNPTILDPKSLYARLRPTAPHTLFGVFLKYIIYICLILKLAIKVEIECHFEPLNVKISTFNKHENYSPLCYRLNSI